MRLSNLPPSCLPVSCLLALAGLAHGQPALDWSLIDGIGGVSATGGIAIVATISADDAVFMANGTVSLHSVFQPWPYFFYQPPARPALQVSLATNHVVLRWPALFSSYQLECASMLEAQGTNWTNVAQPPVTVGNEWQVALPATNLPRFYRLRRE